jgi:hypothetical protein
MIAKTISSGLLAKARIVENRISIKSVYGDLTHEEKLLKHHLTPLFIKLAILSEKLYCNIDPESLKEYSFQLSKLINEVLTQCANSDLVIYLTPESILWFTNNPVNNTQFNPDKGEKGYFVSIGEGLRRIQEQIKELFPDNIELEISQKVTPDSLLIKSHLFFDIHPFLTLLPKFLEFAQKFGLAKPTPQGIIVSFSDAYLKQLK